MTTRASFALVCACLASVSIAAPAAAQEGVAIKSILGNMGIIPPEKDPIRYRERAPLVLPPKSELREPMAASLGATDPQWPNDPDVTAKRRRAAEERRPMLDSEIRRMSDRNPRLTNEEMAAGRTDRREAALPPRQIGDRAGVLLTPDELRAMGKRGEDETVAVGAEPARRTLTEPPAGMRRSASGKAVAPSYDPKIDQQTVDASPLAWIRRQLSSGDDE